MVLQMYCKEFRNRPQNERWCGVIVDINDDANTGEVIDVMLSAELIDLEKWFDEYNRSISEDMEFVGRTYCDGHGLEII